MLYTYYDRILKYIIQYQNNLVVLSGESSCNYPKHFTILVLKSIPADLIVSTILSIIFSVVNQNSVRHFDLSTKIGVSLIRILSRLVKGTISHSGFSLPDFEKNLAIFSPLNKNILQVNDDLVKVHIGENILSIVMKVTNLLDEIILYEENSDSPIKSKYINVKYEIAKNNLTEFIDYKIKIPMVAKPRDCQNP